MRKTRLLLAAAVASTSFFAVQARADDLLEHAAPRKWITPYLPENLPKMDVPDYVSSDMVELAETEAFAGRYKKSLITAQQVKTGDLARIALARGLANWQLGRSDDALAALSAAPAIAADPRVQVLTARVLASIGQTDEAIALLTTHLQGHPDSLAGHYYLGAIDEQAGKTDAARDAYTWFVTPPHNWMDKWSGNSDAFENAEDTVLMGRALDRWASLTSAYQTSTGLNDLVLNVFVKTYDVIDRTYWPAHIAAAEFYLSHDNFDDAMKELKAAVTANPNAIEAHALLAKIAVATFNFDGADASINAIRAVDEHSAVADLLETRNLLQQRRAKEAEAPVQRVLASQPKNIEALGLLAACQSLQLHDDLAMQTIKQVEAIDPNNATAYYEVGEQLRALRQYPRAAEKFKVAVDRAPWWTDARNSLGLLYTQSGDDDLARSTLEAARQLDPYNVETTNYLRLMDMLAKYTRQETAHFIIAYRADLDPVIPLYFADYLESIYTAVTGEFKYEPTVKTIIEVHPTHDAFSVRTTGSPWIGTVGASTGRVIAIVSPRKGENTMGPFNWAQVLRHEFTHTVTLGETDNRIAHWMTEGLAVLQEHTPLRWEWVPMLYQAVTKDKLFDLDQLTWMFVRPKKPIDRQLAYAESAWLCEFIEQKWGHDAVLAMLTDFRNGMTQQEAFAKECGKSQSELFDLFKKWTNAQVSTWGYDDKTTARYDELRTKGEALIASKQFKEAVPVWVQIQQLRPMDALPHQRLAGLYLTPDVDDTQKAIDQLVALQAVELKDDRYDKRVAGLYEKINKLTDAKHYAMQAVYTDPYDRAAHVLLADIDTKAGDTEGATKENKVVGIIDNWADAQKKLRDGDK